jgi:hypothetical protein
MGVPASAGFAIRSTRGIGDQGMLAAGFMASESFHDGGTDAAVKRDAPERQRSMR